MAAQTITPTYKTDLILGDWPCENGEAIRIPILLDGSGDPVDIDLTAIQNTGHFSAAQNIFVDNFDNAARVVITMGGSAQRLIVPAAGQAYLPILQPNPPKIRITSTGNVLIVLFFVNFFLPPIVWIP